MQKCHSQQNEIVDIDKETIILHRYREATVTTILPLRDVIYDLPLYKLACASVQVYVLISKPQAVQDQKPVFHFNHVAAKRSVFFCFVSTRVELMTSKQKKYATFRHDADRVEKMKLVLRKYTIRKQPSACSGTENILQS